MKKNKNTKKITALRISSCYLQSRSIFVAIGDVINKKKDERNNAARYEL